MTEQWSDRSAMLDHKTLPTSGPLSYLHGSALKTRTSSWKREAPLVWTHGMLQRCSQDSLWHTDCWKGWAWEAQDDLEAADREGLQRAEALSYQPSGWRHMEIWCEICHACSKPVTWMGAHCCGYCPCTCMLIKNLMMINGNGKWEVHEM